MKKVKNMKSIKNIGIKVTNNDGPEIIQMLVDCGANNRWNFDGKSYPSEVIYFQSTEHDAIGCQLTKKECKEKFGVIRVFNSLSEFVAWWCKPEFETKLREIGVYSRFIKNLKKVGKWKSGGYVEAWDNVTITELIERINKLDSFKEFIGRSFPWEQTEEGFIFWRNLIINKKHPWEL